MQVFFIGTALAIYFGMVVGVLFFSYVAMLHTTSSVSFFSLFVVIGVVIGGVGVAIVEAVWRVATAVRGRGHGFIFSTVLRRFR